jgi:hypothetical protein
VRRQASAFTTASATDNSGLLEVAYPWATALFTTGLLPCLPSAGPHKPEGAPPPSHPLRRSQWANGPARGAYYCWDNQCLLLSGATIRMRCCARCRQRISCVFRHGRCRDGVFKERARDSCELVGPSGIGAGIYSLGWTTIHASRARATPTQLKSSLVIRSEEKSEKRHRRLDRFERGANYSSVLLSTLSHERRPATLAK